MAARDGAASIQGTMLRVTPLLEDGSIDTTQPVLTTTGFISASFGSEFEDGEEITEKAANGTICIQYKATDSLKGITFNLSLCSPDPEASALLAGGSVICDAIGGEIIGYSSPAVGDAVGNPVAVEIWSRAIINGKPAAGTPYWHWAFPYVRMRYEGDREFTNGALANEFAGTGVGNDALIVDGLNPGINPNDDFVLYKDALVNPFSYVRTAEQPAAGWSGTFVPAPDNSINCMVETVATGATEVAGAAGTWTPADSIAPANLAAMSTVAATPTSAWGAGSHMVLGDASQATWDGTAWTAPSAPPAAATGATAGVPGSWTPSGSTPPANAAGATTAGVTANPTTAWTTGQYVQGSTAGTAGEMHWDGSAWVATKAP